MAGRNGTGPGGNGPMTGRGMGNCGEGNANGLGQCAGFGRGNKMMGRGFRGIFSAVVPKVLTAEEETKILKNRIEAMHIELTAMERRIAELDVSK